LFQEKEIQCQRKEKDRKVFVLWFTLFLFFQTGSREEIKEVEHVQRDKAEEEDEEKAEDELRRPHDDIHFGFLGLAGGIWKSGGFVALKEASARNEGKG
jgi:hypothetical protein